MNGSEIFRTMEIGSIGHNRLPGHILAVITAAHAVIDVDKEGLAVKRAIRMAPEGGERHYKSKFPMGLGGYGIN